MPRASVEESLELYYELHGRGNPVILINGLTSTVESWRYQVPAFSERYQVLIYDCRGQGRSDKPSCGYTGQHHTADLLALTSNLHLGKAHVVGHSFGAYIALNYAIEYPEKVRSLVVSDTAGEAYPLIEKILRSWVDAQEHGGLDLRFDISLPWLYAESFIGSNPRKIRLFREAFRKNDLNAVRGLTLESLENDATPRLREIKAPTLLVLGEEDILTPFRYAEKLLEQIPDARLSVIKGCGHVPPIEKHREFNQIVLEFLGEND
jgi:3-oxoadipate enol-lactonase